MRNATQKEIDKFIEYRANHVALVQRIGSVVFGIDISDHDKDKIEADGEELNLFSLRNSMLNGTYHPHKADRAKLKRLVGKHVKSQKHHPEYWDDSITARNFDDENPPQVNAHKMPKRYLLEMVCDWCAVALKLNKPLFNWYNKTCTGENARFLFTDNQKEYIIECISRVASKIKEENLHYPKVEYTAELDSPKIDFGKKLKESKEDIIYSKEFKDWFGDWENDPEHSSKVVDKDGKPLVVYHGSYNEFDTFKSKGMGIHFGTKQASEDRLSNTADIDGDRLDYESLLNKRKEYAKEKGIIYPCFLNIRNPFILKDFGNSNFISSDIYEYLIDYGFPKEEIDGLLYKDGVYLKEYLISKKFDGIFYKNKIEDEGSISYIVFNSNQIKSATDNNGNFSIESDNMYESRSLLDMSTEEVINLVEEPVIYRKSFKEWFGDWENDPKNSSKMVGRNGKPKVFYHGTNKKFDTFSTDMIGSNTGELGWYGKGFYFTTDYLMARHYGSKVLEVYLNIRHPFYIDSNNLRRYKDELELTDLDLYMTDPARIFKNNKKSVKLSELLIKDGYDGIIYSEDGVSWSEVVVFNPNQIKATDNEGFDKESDNIYEKIKSENKLKESKEDKIYSKEFKEWFGDWENDPEHSSKVVDKDGKPLAVYHGSFSLFNSFDPNKGHNVPAIWHADRLSIASHWSNTSDIHRNSKKVSEDFESLKSLVKELESKDTPFEEVVKEISTFTEENFDTKIESFSHYTSLEACKKYNLDPEESEGIYYGYEIIHHNNEMGITGNVRKDLHKYYERLLEYVEDMIKDSTRNSIDSYHSGFLYKNYLNIRKPLIVDAKDEPYYKIKYKGEYYNTESLAMYAKENGYDGVIVKNVYETDYENKKGTDYIVFNPNQIKSATDNNGNFSKESDNMYEKILHKNNKWVVTDHTGKKNLGTYDTKEEAEKRLKQVEYFKHINENEEKVIDTKESSDVESTTVNEKVITSFGGKVPISNKDKDQILKFCKKAVEDGMKPTKYTEEDMSNSANFSSGSIASNAPENTLKVINLGAEKIEEAFVICSLDGQKVEGTYTTDLSKAKEMRNELADTYKTFFKINKVADIPNFENTEEFKESTEKGKTCVFTFGRYQPPTKGHLKVWKKVADTEGDAHYIYTSHTKDKKKNPLDYNTKVGLIESALKENSINAEVVESEAKTIIDVVVDIANKGFTDIIFVGGSDRLNDIVTLIQKYNDVPNKEGNSYHFDTIEGVSAGERDPDSDSLEGVSGTKIRQFALDNDFESFKNNLAFSDESTAKEVMEIIKSNIK